MPNDNGDASDPSLCAAAATTMTAYYYVIRLLYSEVRESGKREQRS